LFTSKYEAEKIVGATEEFGKLHFLVKWRKMEEADLIPAEIVNCRIPQVITVIFQEPFEEV
jgi:hypothetical protein